MNSRGFDTTPPYLNALPSTILLTDVQYHIQGGGIHKMQTPISSYISIYGTLLLDTDLHDSWPGFVIGRIGFE